MMEKQVKLSYRTTKLQGPWRYHFQASKFETFISGSFVNQLKHLSTIKLV